MSDSNKSASRHLVVSTAGHIDHGKTALVRALTGVETDRLAQEKERGISIDLGFAHTALADDLTLSFVDVPGHENFIKNMLAGVSGVRAAMLVVAADEGVKPQTREHFEICRLLGIKTGVVALTKSDLASDAQLIATRSAVGELCHGSFLDGRPLVAVSAKTGAGLDELRTALRATCSSDDGRDDGSAIARLPVDRSFALKGFGSVVTGTLLRGRIAVGDVVVVHPDLREVRVRGLHAGGKAVDHARAGQRVAMNLTGIDHAEISRGMVVTNHRGLAPSSVFDVAVDWLDAAAIPLRRQQFLLHAGTAEIPVSLKILSAGEPYARIWLSRSALAFPGDRFILRRASPALTVGGGVVLDAFPPVRLNRHRSSQRLRTLASLPYPGIQLLVEEAPGGRKLAELTRRTGLSAEQLATLIAGSPQLTFVEETGQVFGSKWVRSQHDRILMFLADFHGSHPDLTGAPLAEVRMNLDPAAARALFQNLPEIRVQGDVVSLKTHQPKIGNEQSRLLMNLEQAFRAAGYQPPAPADVLATIATEPLKARSLLESLIKANRLVRVKDDLVFHADVMRHIERSLAAHKGRRFSVPEFKEWTQVSRKYAIPLLEYLDRHRITRREGDARVVL